jgi:hypothetical protein
MSVKILHPDAVIQFQQDHSSIHVSHVIPEWLSRQADEEIIE